MSGEHFERGTWADYLSLRRFHYRAGRPATCVRVLRAIDTARGELAGVLVVSMPPLNAPWRRGVWGEAYDGAGPDVAARVNRDIRTISRVIVDPRYRARGIARRLVAFYLNDPETRCTEAISAMGAFCPFFERAGMRATPIPPSRRTPRLAMALRRARLHPARAMDLAHASRVLKRRPVLAREVLAWANDSRATRGLVGRTDPALLLALGASSLVARGIAYTHTREPNP